MKLITNHSMKTDDDILMKNKVTKIIKIKRIVLLLFFKNQCQVYLHHVRVVPVFKVLEYLMSKFSISTIFLCKTFECQLQKKIMPNKVNQQLTKERKEKNFYPLTLLYFNHIYHYIRTIFFFQVNIQNDSTHFPHLTKILVENRMDIQVEKPLNFISIILYFN
jgi:hypothetical protein